MCTSLSSFDEQFELFITHRQNVGTQYLWPSGLVQRWLHCERSGFGSFTLSDAVWCGKGIMATCPAWRWPPRCDAACFFSTFYQRGIVFRRRHPGHDKVGNCTDLAYSASVALQFWVFNRVDAPIQPGESWDIEFPVLMPQSNWKSWVLKFPVLSFLFFFLPMVFQDCSLIFFLLYQ